MSALGKGLGSLIPNKNQKPAIISSDLDENIDDHIDALFISFKQMERERFGKE